MKFRITLNRQHMGDVEIDDELTTDPKAEAFRQGMIQRCDIHLCFAWPIRERRHEDPDT